jgi:hypothetical protein
MECSLVWVDFSVEKVPVLLTEERILPDFMTDRRGWSVTRVDNRLGGKGEQFAPDPRQQEITVASRQIPTAHSTGKENVPAVDRSCRGVMQTEASGAMPRNLENPERASEQGLIPPLEQTMVGGDGLHLQIDAEASEKFPVRQHSFCFRMHGDPATVRADDFGSIPDMVEVPVGQEKQ